MAIRGASGIHSRSWPEEVVEERKFLVEDVPLALDGSPSLALLALEIGVADGPPACLAFLDFEHKRKGHISVPPMSDLRCVHTETSVRRQRDAEK